MAVNQGGCEGDDDVEASVACEMASRCATCRRTSSSAARRLAGPRQVDGDGKRVILKVEAPKMIRLGSSARCRSTLLRRRRPQRAITFVQRHITTSATMMIPMAFHSPDLLTSFSSVVVPGRASCSR